MIPGKVKEALTQAFAGVTGPITREVYNEAALRLRLRYGVRIFEVRACTKTEALINMEGSLYLLHFNEFKWTLNNH